MNTHTRVSIALTLGAALFLFSAGPALAYLTPEQIIMQQQSQTLQLGDAVATPDTRRTVEEQKQAQEFRRVQQHLSDQDSITLKPDYFHTAAPKSSSSAAAGATVAPTTAPAGQGQMSFDPITLRLLERIEKLRTLRQAVGELGDLGLTIDDGMHAGAPIQKKPLSKTGPEAILLLPLITLAFGWTLRRVRNAERGCFTSL